MLTKIFHKKNYNYNYEMKTQPRYLSYILVTVVTNIAQTASAC